VTLRHLEELAAEGVEWCADFKDGQFTPAHTEDGWTVEMHGLAASHAELSAAMLKALRVVRAAQDAAQVLRDAHYPGPRESEMDSLAVTEELCAALRAFEEVE